MEESDEGLVKMHDVFELRFDGLDSRLATVEAKVEESRNQGGYEMDYQFDTPFPQTENVDYSQEGRVYGDGVREEDRGGERDEEMVDGGGEEEDDDGKEDDGEEEDDDGKEDDGEEDDGEDDGGEEDDGEDDGGEEEDDGEEDADGEEEEDGEEENDGEEDDGEEDGGEEEDDGEEKKDDSGEEEFYAATALTVFRDTIPQENRGEKFDAATKPQSFWTKRTARKSVAEPSMA